MAFTLDDLLALPDELKPEHLAAAGLAVPPPAPPPPPGPQPPAPMVAPASSPASVAGPQPPKPIVARPHPAAAAQPPVVPPTIDGIPDGVSPNAGLGSVEGTEAFTKPPALNFKERQALPTISPGVAPGSSAFFENKLGRIEDQRDNPWGSADNHPGWLGKVAHGFAKAGNIAADVVAPGTAALIPDTDLGRRVEEGRLFNKEQEAKTGELATQAEGVKERQEDTKEQHEENYRTHQLAIEKEADDRIANLVQGTKQKGEKISNDNKKWMRSYGLQPDPDNPDGPPIDIPEDQMAPQEVQKMKMGQALMHAREARASFDEYRANPNSPTAQAALMNARAHQQMAGAAATKAGIDQNKFMAEWLGMDRDGNPLAGVKTDETGRPIGPAVTKANATGEGKVAEKWEHDYNKPANDIETAYQMASQAYQDYLRGDAKTGADTMLMLSQHMNTTFGRVKGSRMNRDLIQEHRDAIGLADKTELELGKLVGRGDQLTADQMHEFMGLIKNMRDLTWETTTKEALRHDLPVDFLPQDEAKLAQMPKPTDLRRQNAPAAPAATPAANAPSKTPPAKLEEGHIRSNPKTGEVQKYTNGQWQTTTPPRAAAPAQR